MTNRNESRPTNYQEGTGRNVSLTDEVIGSQNEKELSFEDASLKFRNKAGAWRVSLRQLAEYYEVPFYQASRRLTKNPELFKDTGLDAVRAFRDGKLFDIDLSIRDAFSFLTTLNYKKYSGERKEKLIRLRNWLLDTAEKVLNGELISRSEVDGLFDPSTLTDKPRDIAKDNNLRRALFIKKAREAHPEGPNTYNRLHDLAHNDQRLVQGPKIQFQQGWHRKLSKEQSLKDHAQKMASFAAIACGHIEVDDINRFEQNLFQGLPEKYIPDYIPGAIETTRQVKLIGEVI